MALVDADGKMIGSVMVIDYPSLEILGQEWLEREPYVTGNVWQEIDIRPCRVPDFFLGTTVE